MIKREFRTQVFKTIDQWESGLFYRLNLEKDEGITLFSVPAFTKWIVEADEKTYLFCWDKIPGKDETLLKEFLRHNFSIDWIANAEIQKLNENTIKLFIDDKYVLLHLMNEKTKVNLFISDNRKHELTAKEENGRVNIYAKMNPAAVTLDKCGLIYALDSTSCKLYCYDALSGKRIGTSCIGGCGKDIGKFYNPKKIIFDKYTLWVLDTGNKRLQGFSRENYQIKYVIDKFIEDKNIPEYIKNPVDFSMDKKGNIYILDLRGYKNSNILKYDNHGIQIKSGFKELGEPLSLSISKENILYILDKKCKNGEDKGFKACILKFSDDGTYLGCIDLAIPEDNKSNQYQDFVPSIITIDKNGIFFIASTKFIYQFAPDGSYIGTVQIPDFKDEITGIAVDNKDNLYVSCNKGIAYFSMKRKFTKEKGYFYSKTLDNGKEKSQWHGLSLEGNIPPKTVIEVYYYSDDDLNLKGSIDKIISDPEKSIIKKKNSIENIMKDKWIGPEILSISEKSGKKTNTLNEEILDIGHEKTRLDMLFRVNTRRYLWVKIALSTVDENFSPSINQMKVLYPRESYLRYLPAIYQENPIGQEDPISRDFLERFLSIFETVFYDLETKIYNIYKYFDPDTIDSKDFLKWLASWLNIAIEDEWDENIKRRFIHDAYTLYKQKGTLSGIEKLIEIYTGKKPLITEPSIIGSPMILNEKGAFKLGINSLLLMTPVRGFRLGEDSILGRATLIDGDIFEVSGDPFSSIAHWFTVVLDISPNGNIFNENMLRRILDREKPAHTMYNLIVTGDMKGDSEMYVGMNTRMPDQEHFILGDNSIIGSGILLMSGEHVGKVERYSKVEKDTELT